MMTTDWTPLTESKLLLLLRQAEEQMIPGLHSIWDSVRLPQPELWQQHPWGDEGCGFWVVAVFGRTCIYYNDISAGFCRSTFHEWGLIDQFEQDAPMLDQLLGTSFHTLPKLLA